MSKSFDCDKCLKSFTRKFNLERHIPVCKKVVHVKRFQQEIQEKEDEIQMLLSSFKELKQRVEQLEKTIEIIQGENRSKLFSRKRILGICQKEITNLDINDSTIRIIYHNIIRSKKVFLYRCVDFSRGIFQYQNEKGERVRDVKCAKLIKYTRPIIEDYIHELKRKSGSDSDSYSEDDTMYEDMWDKIQQKEREGKTHNLDKEFDVWLYVNSIDFLNWIKQVTI